MIALGNNEGFDEKTRSDFLEKAEVVKIQMNLCLKRDKRRPVNGWLAWNHLKVEKSCMLREWILYSENYS